MPINCNIPSETCHNRFIFCCEMVPEVLPGLPGLLVLPPCVFSSIHDGKLPLLRIETLVETVSQCLISMYVVSFYDHSVNSSQS